jgi:hypothetical protein
MEEITKLTQKTNWIRQLYFYIIIAGTLTIFCYGTFTFGRAAMIRFIFPKAANALYYGGYNNSEMQCTMGGNEFYQPKSLSKSLPTMDPTKPFIPPMPTDNEIIECKEVSRQGIADQKDRNFQFDAVKGLSLMLVTGIVLAGHYLNRKFFLNKD